MLLINNYWVDENNNRWDADIWSEAEAKEASDKLIECMNCKDCTNCENCRYCTNCTDCRSCRYCTDCTNCTYCTDCEGCTSCADCENCRDCEDCRDCENCGVCTNCTDWKDNPKRMVSERIGRSNRKTTVYFDSTRTEVTCGCFSGTLQEFEEKVKETHKGNEHEKSYMQFIQSVNELIKNQIK